MKAVLIIALLIAVVAVFAVTNAWLLKRVNKPHRKPHDGESMQKKRTGR